MFDLSLASGAVEVERAPDWEAGVLGSIQVTDSVDQASL